jgi:hypothetical protein
MKRKLIAVCILAAASLCCAAISVYSLLIHVPVDDPWLFPMLVVVPAVLAIAFAAATRLPPAIRTNVVLLTLAVLGGLYLLDAAIALVPVKPKPTFAEIASSRGAKFDHRGRLEVAEQMRAQGLDAYVALPADVLRLPPAEGGGRTTIAGRSTVPLALLPNRVIVHCNESGQYSVFRTDEWGFNNPPGSWNAPVDVAAVGDSFVQGACVDSAETLVAHIRRAIPRTLAVGLDGAGPLSMLALIKEYLPRVRPKKVLWFYYGGNDLPNLSSELQVPELRAYLEPGRTQHLAEHASALDSALLEGYRNLVHRPHPRTEATERSFSLELGRWVRLSHVRGALALGGVSERLGHCCDLGAFRATLEEAKRTVQSWGGELIVVYLPAPGRSLEPLSGVFTDELRYRGRVLTLLAEMRLPVVDLNPAFASVKDPNTLFYDSQSHYRPAGYALAGELVVSYLEGLEH